MAVEKVEGNSPPPPRDEAKNAERSREREKEQVRENREQEVRQREDDIAVA